MKRRFYIRATAAAASALVVGFAAVAVVNPRPEMVWNASASVPIGLYRVEPDGNPALGTLVAVMPPGPLAHWLTVRGYLGERVPLLKHVAAKPGQRVCRNAAVVSVDARPVAVARERDGRGRPLPVWQGCRTLRPGELLLLNPASRDSMDGRYFGPLPAANLLGRVTPILTRNAPGAPLTWRGGRS